MYSYAAETARALGVYGKRNCVAAQTKVNRNPGSDSKYCRGKYAFMVI